MTKPSKNPKIVETRDFSCPGMTGFTFKYPVFEGWEPQRHKDLKEPQTKCVIILNHPPQIKFEIAPQIIVTELIGDVLLVARLNNPQGIGYIYNKGIAGEPDNVIFLADKPIKIEVQASTKEDGFSNDLFFQTVIDSFKVIASGRQEFEQKAIRIAIEFMKSQGLDPAEFDVERIHDTSGVAEQARVDISWKKRDPNMLGGDGKSRELLVDLKKNKVIKEIWPK